VTAVEYLDQLGKAPAGGSGPFDRAEWWALLVRHAGARPLFARVSNGDATALLALRKEGATLRALSNWYTFRWRPLISPGAPAPDLLDAIARDLPHHGWRLTLDQVPDEDGSATLLADALRRAGWRVSMDPHDLNHVLPLAGRSYAEYLASRPGALRTTLKRRTAKVETRVLDHFEENVWREYEAIYAASWKPEEGLPAMLEDFARAEGAAGRLRLGIAHIDGQPVAAQFWTVESGTAWIHKLAHRDDAKAMSPGTVLSAALFARVIDGYKRDWMDEIRPRYRIDAVWPRAPRAWLHGAVQIARRLAGRGPRR